MVGGLLLPIAHIHGLLRIIFGLPNARFDRKREKGVRVDLNLRICRT